MAISSINGNYNANLVALFQQAAGESGGGAALLGKSTGVRGGVAPSLAGGEFSTRTQKALSEALAIIRSETKERITYETVERYRTAMEAQFSENLREALKKKGVDPKIEFKLVADANGDVKVVSTHKDKAMVEKYLADNPKMVEQFQHIQALSNVKRTAENETMRNNPGATMGQIKKQLQAQAVQAYFTMLENPSASFSSMIANFDASGGQAAYTMGLNYKV